jgi:hypothetical protein
MAETAFQTMYRDEWIAAFERDGSSLKSTVTTEAMIKGRIATFLVSQSSREAVTRGANGLIAATADNLTQSTVTLAEAHDLPQKTGYNIFAGQSDQRAMMQTQSRKVINRHIDDIILAVINTGSVTINATASIMTKQLVNRGITRLYQANVQNDGNVYGLLTPAAWAHLSDVPDFASSDYVASKPMIEGAPQGGREMKRWLGVTWMVHTGLSGLGTSSAKCYIYHRDAVGYAYDKSDVQALAGYNQEQDYSWARTSIFDGALLIQNSGVVVFNHDDSQYGA